MQSTLGDKVGTVAHFSYWITSTSATSAQKMDSSFTQGVMNSLTYASVVTRTSNFSISLSASRTVVFLLSHSSDAIKKENSVSIQVNHMAFQDWLNICRFSLIAKVVLTIEDTPWKLADLTFFNLEYC